MMSFITFNLKQKYLFRVMQIFCNKKNRVQCPVAELTKLGNLLAYSSFWMLCHLAVLLVELGEWMGGLACRPPRNIEDPGD